MTHASVVSYAHLEGLLLRLGFVHRSVKGSHRGFYHSQSDTWILFSDYASGNVLARDVDIASVRRHLLEKGLIDEPQFERLIGELAGKLMDKKG